MRREPPTIDEKIGKKMDFIAAELGDVLKQYGFSRKARRFTRQVGSGNALCTQVLDIQGDKWNAGSKGKFCINVGVHSSSVLNIFADVTGYEWARQSALEAATEASCLRGRLQDTLPEVRADWWPNEMDRKKDVWFEIQSETDIGLLSQIVNRSVISYVLPFFEQLGSLEGIFKTAGNGSIFYEQSWKYALIAGVLLQKYQECAQLFKDQSEKGISEKDFNQMKDWLISRGIDVSSVEHTPRPASRSEQMHALRVKDFEAAKSKFAANEMALVSDSAPLIGRLGPLLVAYGEGCRTRIGNHQVSPIWIALLNSDVSTRRATVFAVMQELPHIARSQPSLHPGVIGNMGGYDDSWRDLVAALLRSLDCDEVFALELLKRLPPLIARTFEATLLQREITPTFACVGKYLIDQGRPWSERLKPLVGEVIKEFHRVALAIHDQHVARLDSIAIKREDLAMTIEQNPESRQEFRKRLQDYPEQLFVQSDRKVIAEFRKLLRRRTDGRDSIEIELDDWGVQLLQEIATNAAATQILLPLFEWFGQHEQPIKPTRKFLSELTKLHQELKCDLNESSMKDLLGKLLSGFKTTSLSYEWASSAPRPGVGAFVGEISGRILIGLIHLSRILDAEAFVEIHAEIVVAGLTYVPGAKVRFQRAASAAIDCLSITPAGQKKLIELRGIFKKPGACKLIDSAIASGTSSS